MADNHHAEESIRYDVGGWISGPCLPAGSDRGLQVERAADHASDVLAQADKTAAGHGHEYLARQLAAVLRSLLAALGAE